MSTDAPREPNRRWWAHAACRGMDPALFFPDKETGPDTALEVCAGCPVTDECLDDAYRFGDDGVWGGTTRSYRRRNRRLTLWPTACKWCARAFVPTTRTAVYCSHLCRRASANAASAAWYRANVAGGRDGGV